MNTNDRMHRIAGIAAVAASVAWLVAWGLYISSALGFDTLPALPPDQVAYILFGFLLPPVLVWVLLAYWIRGRELAQQTDRINNQLERLTVADNRATDRV